MKVNTSHTVRVGAGKGRKYLAPGEHDFPPDVAEALIKSGAATAAAKDESTVGKSGGKSDGESGASTVGKSGGK